MLLVAHGTRSPAGTATTRALAAAIAAARPTVPVSLCYLDVTEPALPDAVARADENAVLVPLLLSTGYHVESDIPAAVRARPDIAVARHLGPHPLLVDALADRLPAGRFGSTVLVATGSSRPGAAREVAEVAAALGERLGEPVTAGTVGDGLADAFAGAAPPVRVATYLLAEGRFGETLAAAAGDRVRVAPPLGVHPALVELAWRRYDEAAGG